MQSKRKPNDTPWRAGRFDGKPGRPRVLFPRMFEDWAIERAAFRGRRRVLCIASGGCTAIALAGAGHEVTAVDINPAQIDFVRARLTRGAPSGSTHKFLPALRRTMLRILGLSPALVDEFLGCDSVSEQGALWGRLWNARVALATRLALHPAVLRWAYDPRFVALLPSRFDAVIERRMRSGISRHLNRDNPFVWQLVTGRRPERLEPAAPRDRSIRLICADVIDHLERAAPASFDALTLSNILDGCDERYAQRLACAVRRAAAPGAVVILRSLADSNRAGASWHTLDRAHIWGEVSVECLTRAAPRGRCRFGRPVFPQDMETDDALAA